MGENSRIHSPKKRMSTLLQAAQLGSVAKVCREAGISRSTYYDWKKRFREQGKAGLVTLPTVHHAHPQTTAKHTEDQIMSLALANPALGCDRIRDLMPDDGNMVSSTTVHKILNRHGLGNRSDRWLAL